MHVAFDFMPEEERIPSLEGYVRSLEERDGPLNEAELTLPNRERFLERWKTNNPGWKGKLPMEAFQRLVSGKGTRSTDSPLALWMAYMAMTNEAEEYGVRARLKDPFPEDPLEGVAYRYIAREELYHTRMLLDCVRALGAEAKLAPPPLTLRLFLRFFPKLPQMWTDCITLIAESVGVTLFCRLRAIAFELFGQEPIGPHLASAMDEIIIDEVGHVTFLRSRLGEEGLVWARRLAPLVTPLLVRSFPMAGPLLGLEAYRHRIENFTWSDLPASVRARAWGPWMLQEARQAS